MLAHIVILHKDPEGQGSTATSNWTQALSCPGQGHGLFFKPKSQRQKGHFLCSQESGFSHQQPYAFGNIHQLKNSLSWKKRLSQDSSKYFLNLWKTGSDFLNVPAADKHFCLKIYQVENRMFQGTFQWIKVGLSGVTCNKSHSQLKGGTNSDYSEIHSQAYFM